MNMIGFKKHLAKGLAVLVLLVGCGMWWGYAHLTTLVQSRLKSMVGDGLTLGKVTARWNRVELDNVRIARHGGPGRFADRLTVERIVIRPSLLSLLSGRLDISEIVLEKPWLLLEIAPDGSLVKILQPRKEPPSRSSPASLPVRINTLKINNGSLDLLDRHISRRGGVGLSNPREQYHLVTFQSIAFSADFLTMPASKRASPVRLDVACKGGGTLSVRGEITPKGLDTHLKLELAGLDITKFRPYFLKKGDLGVASGKLSASSTITIENRRLNAPGTLRLSNLAFANSGAKGLLMGVPAWAFIKFLSDNKDELQVDFSLSGSLDDPHFAVRQTLVDQVATALASKIGISSVTSIGKGIIDMGEKGIKKIFGGGK
ncbi:DUF748 domain-containing protein [Geobacter sp. AOG2]|uniref:DUF748 domain-containing protein n=1 Tax=Geobacter sp. AOG2 TaxID=1566347 RepID=UPI001CC50163|nr:DUF748 domain-containing protein [Geobacter sp. AOG2]GFE61050.1 hypothetical protein AOG2_16370 [Geobacter sp. AOG2]